MKQRFSSLDVKVIAHELSKTLVPLRVSNIYDLSTRIFLFKFHKTDHREQLIVDSGFRCHLTNYARTTASAPSGFVTRLRKYLKTRRVTKISQIGTDRIIELEFSDGLYRLYLEFYAGGNIVLTDGDLKILALLRNVEEGAEHEQLRVGLQYNLSLRQNYGGVPPLTKERVREGLQKAVDRQQEPAANAKKPKKQNKDALRKALAVSITECPPLLVDHALHAASFDSNLKPQEVLADDTLLDKLLAALQGARNISEHITDPETVKGYILAKPNPAAKIADDQGIDVQKSNLLYDDFHPFKPQQFEHSDYNFLEFDGFNKAVDEFFSSIEGQKLESKLHERELAAKKKLDHAHQEHAKRLGGLQEVQQLNYRKAEAIQANVHWVTEAIAAVNGLIGQGMDWGEIARLIEREQSQGNPVATMIKLPLKLYENTITLLLGEANWEAEDEDDEGYQTSSVSEDSDEDDAPAKQRKTPARPIEKPKLAVDVNLGLTPWANAGEYFDEKKFAKSKEERTAEASAMALKNHERKVAADLKKGLQQEKEVLRPVRKQFWFEKFIYFVSSDGYLVLGGKDGTQSDIIYRKYFRKGDVFVHAELKGAVPLIIKNNPNTPDAPIPPSTLSQAGNLSVSTSEAWDSKAVMSAWWVNADEVSKLAPTGDYLQPGAFHVKGKKNFLPPAQLILGFAVMFEISEESKARHQKHRIVDPVITDASQSATLDEELAAARESVTDQKAEDDDSDEDFPDAKIESGTDDDFPDARLQSDSEDSDAEEQDAKPSNPLQSNNLAQEAESEDDEAEVKNVSPSSGGKDGKDGSPEDDDDEQEDEGTVADSEEAKPKIGKRHLTARERRLLRKGQPLDTPATSSGVASQAGGASDEDEDANSIAPSGKAATTTASQTSKATTKSQPSKGKRSKAKKKLAAKYADQDEEDRALAMRLLGLKTGPQVQESQAQAKKSKEEEVLANKQRRRDQHLRAQAAGRAAEEAREKAHSGAAPPEDDAEDEEVLKQNLLALDALIGRPLPGDDLLTAIPVCAPWSALSTYKYKAKIQPGSTKRGKAVKEILSRWDAAGKNPKALDKEGRDGERIWPREMELIRGWKEVEVLGVLPVGKVRVMMGGGSGGGAGGKKATKSARGGRGSKRK